MTKTEREVAWSRPSKWPNSKTRSYLLASEGTEQHSIRRWLSYHETIQQRDTSRPTQFAKHKCEKVVYFNWTTQWWHVFICLYNFMYPFEKKKEKKKDCMPLWFVLLQECWFPEKDSLVSFSFFWIFLLTLANALWLCVCVFFFVSVKLLFYIKK